MKRAKRTELHKKIDSFGKAIRAHCYHCNGDVKKIDCGVRDCALYAFRPFEKSPRSHLKKD